MGKPIMLILCILAGMISCQHVLRAMDQESYKIRVCEVQESGYWAFQHRETEVYLFLVRVPHDAKVKDVICLVHGEARITVGPAGNPIRLVNGQPLTGE